jgi:hypothetical protein
MSRLGTGKPPPVSNSFLQLTSDMANNLINDRVQFKIYAAEYELNGLKNWNKMGQP